MNECFDWLMLAVFIIGVVSLVGFFVTKEKGFGKFSTSAMLLILVVVFSGLFFSSGKIDSQVVANLLFAIIGFSGGLFAGKGVPGDGSLK